MKALIVYHSVSGHTLEAARYVEHGLVSAGFEVVTVRAEKYNRSHLVEARVVAVGTPCHLGSLPWRSGISRPIREFLERLPPASLKTRVAVPFCVHCLRGGGKTLDRMRARFLELGAAQALPGLVIRAGSVLSLWQGRNISEAEANALRALGQRAAALVPK